MHRITWFAIPIVGLVALSSGLGIWSYHLNAQNQALVTQSDTAYSAAFHSLVSDMDDLTGRLSEASVSSDASGFGVCVRDIWRMSFAAQTEIAKLPVELMPLHHTQEFLSSLSSQSDQWLRERPTARDPKVQKEVDTYYKQAANLKDELVSIQGKVLDGGLGWVAVNRSINQKNGYHTGDNQVVDGFRKMDKGLSTFSETAVLGAQVEGSRKTGFRDNGTIASPTVAMKNVAKMINANVGSDWKTTTSTLGGRETVYMISGTTSYGPLSAVVTRQGGHVLSIHVDRKVGNSNFGFADAEAKAQVWLKQNGFGTMTADISNEYDHIGYFVFVPETKNGWAIHSPVSVNIALDNGELLAVDAQAYYTHPVPVVAPLRKYTAAQLQKRLNPQLHVEESRNVVLKDVTGATTSGVEFIGTKGKQTYSVILDAKTGKEISVHKVS